MVRALTLAARVNYSASTACDECSGSSHELCNHVKPALK